MKDKNQKKSFLKTKKFWFFTIILIVIAAFIGYKLTVGKNSGKEKSVVEWGKVTQELVLSGEITADEYAKLGFPTSGDIAWISAKEGDTVKKGMALAKLDTTVLNTYYQQAKATLRAAEATVEYVHDQVKDNDNDETFLQKDTRTTAEVTKDKAYEAFVAAEYNLRNATITAPFAGIVTAVAHPYSGVFVLASETQIELINPETMYFDVTADQTEVLNLFVGQDVEILLDSLPDDTLKGKIVFISYTPRAGEVGSVYKVRVGFENENMDIKKYRIGLSGDAKFILQEKENVLFVPPRFVNVENGKYFVHTSDKDGKVFVEIGLEGEDRTEITGGDIKEGETIYD
ncbi:MAG TPA: efflux RND transporter periplasmic adaptor subunit [Patescibacteria group bacterium]|nr:efflux RND transporter periplasmic adaptor subunit [Patescibacteria group bacterium]